MQNMEARASFYSCFLSESLCSSTQGGNICCIRQPHMQISTFSSSS